LIHGIHTVRLLGYILLKCPKFPFSEAILKCCLAGERRMFELLVGFIVIATLLAFP